MATSSVHTIVLSNDLGKIADGMEDKASQFVRKAALDIQAGAQVRAPVDTGALRASIQAVQASGPLHWQVRVGVEYGIYVEMGTRHMAAQPYLGPAAEAVRSDFLRAMRTVVEP